ncbi:MAG: 3-oxoacyl-[acyl-carrier-protein] reductase [Planctomycetota bacterium]|jgi:3-oxoacyl-[acyl-carrier protein] reductase
METRNALVTGASRGIGRGVAVALAAAGHRVFCLSTSAGGCDETIAECKQLGAEAQALVGDIADADAVADLAKSMLDEIGMLHVLVNNAGITRDGWFTQMSDEDFDRVLAVNLRGAFLTCRAFARAMAKERWGRIVNVSSVVGVMGNPGQANYGASKAGLIGFSKSLAREMGGRGVTVNVVAPGFIETDMTQGLGEDVRASVLQNIPLNRFGTSQDVAAAVRFLCSDAASYITGQVLLVDGGMAM